MNKIKFSHKYPKLHGQKQAELLRVVIVSYYHLHKDLIEYDTKYIFNERKDHHGTTQDYEEGYYPLPKTNLLHLTFVGDKGIPFCTIRRHTVQKFSYYKRLVGEKFEIVNTAYTEQTKEEKK